MKWAFAISVWTLLSAPVIHADEFLDRVKALEAINAAHADKEWYRCPCVGEGLCPEPTRISIHGKCECSQKECLKATTPVCPCGRCDCDVDGHCRHPACVKCTAKAVILPSAPAISFRHVCGCNGGYQCNCGSVCHCTENIAFNRQLVRWVWDDDEGRWYLYQGKMCLGATNTSGSFFPWTGTDYGPKSLPPAGSPPIPAARQSALPSPQSGGPRNLISRRMAAPVCRT